MKIFKYIAVIIFVISILVMMSACFGGDNAPPSSPVEPGEPIQNGEQPKQRDNEHKMIVILYYVDENFSNTYKVKHEITGESTAEFLQTTFDLWIEGPQYEGLQAILPLDVKINFVKAENGVAFINFSKDILDANLGSSGEAAIIEHTALIVGQFGFEKTQILVEGKQVETLLGHMYIYEPVEAKDASDYSWYVAS